MAGGLYAMGAQEIRYVIMRAQSDPLCSAPSPEPDILRSLLFSISAVQRRYKLNLVGEQRASWRIARLINRFKPHRIFAS